jgi:membrane protein
VNWISLLITVGLAVVLIAGGVAISIKGSWDERIDGLPFAIDAIMRMVVFGVAIAIVAAVVATIYRYAPDRPTSRWSWITPGSLFATIGAIVTMLAFAFYVANFAGYTATYGALGAIVVLLMWFWLTSLALCIGAEINGHLERTCKPDGEVPIDAA